MIQDALDTTNGNREKAAKLLGISLRSLQYKIKKYFS
jgi:transcriptional regulator with PAS, ATPase and Fis domain